jgi:purine-cytosine permease-like protein
MKIFGWIVVACFALTAAAASVLVARWFNAPDQVCSFIVALIGAVATCYGPRLLETVSRIEAR